MSDGTTLSGNEKQRRHEGDMQLREIAASLTVTMLEKLPAVTSLETGQDVAKPAIEAYTAILKAVRDAG